MIGAIIECVKVEDCTCHVCRSMAKPTKGSRYMVRAFYKKGSIFRYNNGDYGKHTCDMVLLEEIVNPVISPLACEPAFPVYWFKELLPPMEICLENILVKETT